MEINLSKIKMTPGASHRFSFEETLSPEEYGYGEYRLEGSVTCEGSVTNSGNGSYALSASYSSVAVLICSRCGQDFSIPVSGEMEAMFSADPSESEDGECSVYRFENDCIDLGEAVAGEIFFSLPMQPLCREDCRGLCPVCGADLNKKSCSCQSDRIDPRWEKLKNFMIDIDED